jgi:hypothetical protein
MNHKEIKLLKKPLTLWLVSIALFAVIIEGILSFPGILSSAESGLQIAVAVSHALYALSGIAIITGLWLSLRAAPYFVIIWGITGLGAALGGPLAYSKVDGTFSKTAALMVLLIFLITAGLFLYSRYIVRKESKKS